MASNNDIINGMTFEELLHAESDSESTYSALIVDLVDQIELMTSPGVDSDLNVLVEQMLHAVNEDEQHLVANALCDKLNKITQMVDQVISDDLDSQLADREQLNNLNIAAALIPPETVRNTKLFETIASEQFKKIVDM
jgi:hypothetical protein